MKRRLLIGGLLLTAGTAHADPCGMVPPIYVGENGATIKRIGPQKTYMKKNNLTFSRYEMPKAQNTSVKYDAVQAGPGDEKEGILVEGDVDPAKKTTNTPGKSWYDTLWGN